MREYTIINGSGLPMTVQLDDETAKQLDAKPVTKAKADESKAAEKPANKARQPQNKKV